MKFYFVYTPDNKIITQSLCYSQEDAIKELLFLGSPIKEPGFIPDFVLQQMFAIYRNQGYYIKEMEGQLMVDRDEDAAIANNILKEALTALYFDMGQKGALIHIVGLLVGKPTSGFNREEIIRLYEKYCSDES